MTMPATIILPTDYPQMPAPCVDALRKTLRDPKVADNAARVLEAGKAGLRKAVLRAVDRLGAATEDPASLYAEAHEIRGLAGNAGLPSAANIASLLCRYLDMVRRAGRPVDPEVTALHIMALVRATHAGNDTMLLADVVQRELSALVARKITELAVDEVPASFSAR